MGEEAERAHAVVERHQDDVLAGPVLTVELRLGAPAFAEAAAEDPHGHGQLLVHLPGGLGPDIQVKAVLAVGRLVAVAPLGGVATRVMNGLEGRVAELVADLHALPGHDGLRRAPAVFADGRRGVRDAAIDGDAGCVIQDNTLNLTALDSEDGVLGSSGAGCQRQCAKEDQYLFHNNRISFSFHQGRNKFPHAQERICAMTKKRNKMTQNGEN